MNSSSLGTQANLNSLRRVFASVAFLGVATVLGGCPIWDENDHYTTYPGSGSPSCKYAAGCSCDSSFDCPNGYSCQSGVCQASSGPTGTCSSSSQCGTGSVCGSDSRCHVGNCTQYGCSNGAACTLVHGTPTCVAGDGGAGDSGPGFDAGAPECTTDVSCLATHGTGAKCLSGSCVAQADQCTDATQCSGNAQCVDGVCTPACDSTHACPTGYSCDANGVCTGNSSPCGSSATCSSGNACVAGHCVSQCGPGGACSTGLVCVGGGCVPDEKPVFVCDQEGVRDACAAGSICLHHSCYIGCSADAGADAGACKSADKFNVCKSVETTSGSYSVCGSAGNLGTECDPTLGKACGAGKVCIDGFCR